MSPRRVVDGDSLYVSEKLGQVEPVSYRPEFATLLTLANSHAVFECNAKIIWARVYSCNRPDVAREKVAQILDEYERVKLLFRFQDGQKIFGHWVGSLKPGRLPAKSERKNEKRICRKIPTDELAEFLGVPPEQIYREDLDDIITSIGDTYLPSTTGTGTGTGFGTGSGTGLGIRTGTGGSDGRMVPSIDGSDQVKVKPQASPSPQVEELVALLHKLMGSSSDSSVHFAEQFLQANPITLAELTPILTWAITENEFWGKKFREADNPMAIVNKCWSSITKAYEKQQHRKPHTITKPGVAESMKFLKKAKKEPAQEVQPAWAANAKPW